MDLPGEHRSAGYLSADRVSDVDEFASAVRRVAEGGSALDLLVVSELLVGVGGTILLDEPHAARSGYPS